MKGFVTFALLAAKSVECDKPSKHVDRLTRYYLFKAANVLLKSFTEDRRSKHS